MRLLRLLAACVVFILVTATPAYAASGFPPTPVAPTPVAVTAGPRGSVYVASSGIITAVDGASGHILRTFPGPVHPGGMAYSPSSKRLWVTSLSDATVYQYEADSGTPAGSVAVGDGPYAVLLDDDSGRAFVSDSLDDAVSIIKTSDGSVVSTVDVGAEPYGLAFDHSTGRLAVAARSGNEVDFVDPATATVTNVVPVPGGPVDVVANPSQAGTFEVLATDMGLLYSITATGQAWPPMEVGTTPYGIAPIPGGQLFAITSTGTQELLSVDPTCSLIATKEGTGRNPTAVAILNGPRAVVIATEDNTVSGIDLPSSTSTCRPSPTSTSTGLSPSSTSTGTAVLSPSPTVTGTPTPAPAPGIPPIALGPLIAAVVVILGFVLWWLIRRSRV